MKRGGKLALAPLLQNLGNVAASGSAEVSVFLSTDGTFDLTDALALTINKPVKLKPGTGKPQKLKVTVPDTIAAGSYSAFVVFNTVGRITETQSTNNIAGAANTIAVS